MKIRILAIIILLCNYSFSAVADGNLPQKQQETTTDSIHGGLQYLKQLTQDAKWHFNTPDAQKSISGLIHFLEDEQIDTILLKISRIQNDSLLVFRNWQDVSDTLSIPGYMPNEQITEKMQQLDRDVRDQNPLEKIPIPEYLLTNLERKIHFTPKEEVQSLIDQGIITIPDSLKKVTYPKDSLKTGNRQAQQQQDSLRMAFIEKARIEYNDRLLRNYIDSISNDYRIKALTHFSDSLQNQLKGSLQQNNQNLIIEWNDSAIQAVNDSIRRLLPILSRKAYQTPQDVWLYNLTNDSIKVRLRNNDYYFTRMFIKNKQKDSLGVKIENLGRNSMRILIDDGVTFTRFSEQQKRDIKFDRFEPTKKDFEKVEKRYNVFSPWTLNNNSSLGFTQTSLSNWKKGGNSSFSILGIIKASANYSYNKIKWNNSIEMRNGWIRLNNTDSDAKVQKNDDKLEIISQFGFSAFNSKKWYYSAEIDFETQFFNGYNYDKDPDTPISAFLSPSKTLIKLGFDYNPNKNFSLVLSPLTSKTVSVRDTAKIDQTEYGIDKDKRRLWDPGLNADLKYTRELMENVKWSTKYKMFVNYRSPFTKFDVNWENQITMKVNDYININLMLYLLYDDNVTFATNKTDAEGKTIYEPKWQIKELFTVGFSFNMNKKLYRRQKIK